MVPGSRPYKGTTPGNHPGNHLAGVAAVERMSPFLASAARLLTTLESCNLEVLDTGVKLVVRTRNADLTSSFSLPPAETEKTLKRLEKTIQELAPEVVKLLAWVRRDATTPPAGHQAPPAGAEHPHLALVSRPEDLPACGHDGALVLLTVKGQGRLCGGCWVRWVRGDIAWPALAVVRERGQA